MGGACLLEHGSHPQNQILPPRRAHDLNADWQLSVNIDRHRHDRQAGEAQRLGVDADIRPERNVASADLECCLVEARRGVALGGLWLVDRGAWMAVGASAAWSWTLGALVRGGLVDVRFAAPGDASPAALIVAAAAAAAFSSSI